MVSQTNFAEEANEMFSTKTRSSIVALVASLSLGVAAVAPAVSQAKPKGQTVAVTCPDEGFSGGPGQPGEIAWNKYTVVGPDGKTLVGVEDEMICGSDGKWHKVANVVKALSGVAAPVAVVSATR
jgi:hypothetical protein